MNVFGETALQLIVCNRQEDVVRGPCRDWLGRSIQDLQSAIKVASNIRIANFLQVQLSDITTLSSYTLSPYKRELRE